MDYIAGSLLNFDNRIMIWFRQRYDPKLINVIRHIQSPIQIDYYFDGYYLKDEILHSCRLGILYLYLLEDKILLQHQEVRNECPSILPDMDFIVSEFKKAFNISDSTTPPKKEPWEISELYEREQYILELWWKNYTATEITNYVNKKFDGLPISEKRIRNLLSEWRKKFGIDKVPLDEQRRKISRKI